jgi:hypothetical protein
MTPCNRATVDGEETTLADETNLVALDSLLDTIADSAFMDGSFEAEDVNLIPDVSMNTEENNVDAAVADENSEENFVDNYVDSAIADAAVADTLVADTSFETEDFVDQNFDAAAADTQATLNPQQTQSAASSGMQGWMVAIVVLFSIVAVLLLAVIVLSVTVLRRH